MLGNKATLENTNINFIVDAEWNEYDETGKIACHIGENRAATIIATGNPMCDRELKVDNKEYFVEVLKELVKFSSDGIVGTSLDLEVVKQENGFEFKVDGELAGVLNNDGFIEKDNYQLTTFFTEITGLLTWPNDEDTNSVTKEEIKAIEEPEENVHYCVMCCYDTQHCEDNRCCECNNPLSDGISNLELQVDNLIDAFKALGYTDEQIKVFRDGSQKPTKYRVISIKWDRNEPKEYFELGAEITNENIEATIEEVDSIVSDFNYERDMNDCELFSTLIQKHGKVYDLDEEEFELKSL